MIGRENGGNLVSTGFRCFYYYIWKWQISHPIKGHGCLFSAVSGPQSKQGLLWYTLRSVGLPHMPLGQVNTHPWTQMPPLRNWGNGRKCLENSCHSDNTEFSLCLQSSGEILSSGNDVTSSLDAICLRHLSQNLSKIVTPMAGTAILQC